MEKGCRTCACVPVGLRRVNLSMCWSHSEWRNSYLHLLQLTCCRVFVWHLLKIILVHIWRYFASFLPRFGNFSAVCVCVCEWLHHLGCHVVSSCPPFCDSVSCSLLTCFYRSFTKLAQAFFYQSEKKIFYNFHMIYRCIFDCFSPKDLLGFCFITETWPEAW